MLVLKLRVVPQPTLMSLEEGSIVGLGLLQVIIVLVSFLLDIGKLGLELGDGGDSISAGLLELLARGFKAIPLRLELVELSIGLLELLT